MFLNNICKFDRCGKTFPRLHDLIVHIEDTHISRDPEVHRAMEEGKPTELPLSYILPYKSLNQTVRMEMPQLSTELGTSAGPQLLTKSTSILELQLATKSDSYTEPQLVAKSASNVEPLFATKSTSIVETELVSKSATSIDMEMVTKNETLPKETTVAQLQLVTNAECAKEPSELQSKNEIFSNNSKMSGDVQLVPIETEDKGLGATNNDDSEKTDVDMATVKIEGKDLETNKAGCNNNRYECFCGNIFKTMRGMKQHARMKHFHDVKESGSPSESPVARKQFKHSPTETCTSTVLSKEHSVDDQQAISIDPSSSNNGGRVNATGGINSLTCVENNENAEDETATNATLPVTINSIYNEHNYCINPNK